MHDVYTGGKVTDFVLDCYVPQERKKSLCSLSDALGDKKYLALFFYPEDRTSVCTTTLAALSKPETYQAFEQRNTARMAVSTDPVSKHENWAEEFATLRDTPLLMAADAQGALSRHLSMYNEPQRCAERGIVIIDRNLLLRSRHAFDMDVGGKIAWTLELLDQLGTKDAHPGEFCPTDHLPGMPLIR